MSVRVSRRPRDSAEWPSMQFGRSLPPTARPDTVAPWRGSSAETSTAPPAPAIESRVVATPATASLQPLRSATVNTVAEPAPARQAFSAAPIAIFVACSVNLNAEDGLEIQPGRGGDVGVGFVILLDVFRADDFGPVVGAAPISDGPGPRCREYAVIVDREVDLQVLAGRSRRPHRAPVLLCVARQAFLGFFEVDQPIALHHMQLLSERCAEQVDHRVLTVGPRAHGIDHQRVALVVADRIPIPRRRQRHGMLLIHGHVSDFMVLLVEYGDLMRLLQ